MPRQVYILKNRGKGSLNDVTADSLFLLVDESQLGVVENDTTVELDMATLDATYLNANNTFKVYCFEIIGGGLVYEKTEFGWTKNAIERVT